MYKAVACVVAAAALALLLQHSGYVVDPAQAYRPVQVALLEPEASVRRLAGLIQFKTVSRSAAPNHITDPTAFRDALQYLERQYPVVWSQAEVHKVNEHSLLIKVEGSDRLLKPLLFISHLDVVPAHDGDNSTWTYPPYSGTVADGFKPTRTLYLAIGHDEEVGGDFGARAMADIFARQGVEFAYIIDEGACILSEGLRPVTDTPIALIGTAEKGMATVEVEADGPGGHAGSPPTDGSSVPAVLGRLVTAVDGSPMRASLRPPTTHFLQALAPVAKLPGLGVLLRHCDTWPLSSILGRLMAAGKPDMAALARTTIATTWLSAGVADNVLPPHGRAVFNVRLLPGDEPSMLLGHFRSALGRDDHAARVRIYNEESPTSLDQVPDPRGRPFQLIRRAALETLQDEKGMVVAPFLAPFASDSRHYMNLTRGGAFRFIPFTYSRSSERMPPHSVDERCKVRDFLNAIRFYIRTMELCGSDAEAD